MTVSRRARTLRLGAVSYFTGLAIGLVAGNWTNNMADKELGLAQSTEDALAARLEQIVESMRNHEQHDCYFATEAEMGTLEAIVAGMAAGRSGNHAEEVGQLQADNVRLLDLVAAHEEAIAARDAMQRATARQQQAVQAAMESGAVARTAELAKGRG